MINIELKIKERNDFNYLTSFYTQFILIISLLSYLYNLCFVEKKFIITLNFLNFLKEKIPLSSFHSIFIDKNINEKEIFCLTLNNN